MNKLLVLPCLDSEELVASRRQELTNTRGAAELGRTAVEAAREGFYITEAGQKIVWRDAVQTACVAKLSIAPNATLPSDERLAFAETMIQVSNETTLRASRRLVESGLQPLALNFANGIHPGGGFLAGATAQEESLCRSSALYQTLVGDPMYEAHRKRQTSDSDWAIYSPNVPVFRMDNGTELQHPWLLSFLTCAAPYAPVIGKRQSAQLLEKRLHRVLAIARAYKHSALVLGAWGCGVFENDPYRLAADFRKALENEFSGAFSDIVFAITDWSPERKFLGPFRDVFAAEGDASRSTKRHR